MDEAKMTAITEEANALLAETGLFTADYVHTNCEPHPYMVGPAHVAHAADKFMHRLGTAAIEDYERTHSKSCAHPGCMLKYREHKTSYLLMLRLTRDLENREAAEALSTLKPMAEREGLEGFGFLNLDKEFKIAPPEEQPA